mmetsp:Transcript_51243/g.166130  ORF Transcript_51243/g.166130 Transcript_51243/m.166130 type:complete len:354 (-) Transcript_51243:219-1280(-)
MDLLHGSTSAPPMDEERVSKASKTERGLCAGRRCAGRSDAGRSAANGGAAVAVGHSAPTSAVGGAGAGTAEAICGNAMPSRPRLADVGRALVPAVSRPQTPSKPGRAPPADPGLSPAPATGRSAATSGEAASVALLATHPHNSAASDCFAEGASVALLPTHPHSSVVSDCFAASASSGATASRSMNSATKSQGSSGCSRAMASSMACITDNKLWSSKNVLACATLTTFASASMPRSSSSCNFATKPASRRALKLLLSLVLSPPLRLVHCRGRLVMRSVSVGVGAASTAALSASHGVPQSSSAAGTFAGGSCNSYKPSFGMEASSPTPSCLNKSTLKVWACCKVTPGNRSGFPT